MTTVEFITALFYEIDEQLRAIPKHPDAHLWPSEVVTLGLLHALKGGGNRPFYRWLTRDYRPLFPRLPERTRLFRLFMTHHAWTQVFLAAPTVLGVIDTYGIELIHPIREGRSPQQIGRKGLSNHRWIVGGKLCLLLNQYGLVVAWACDTSVEPYAVQGFCLWWERAQDLRAALPGLWAYAPHCAAHQRHREERRMSASIPVDGEQERGRRPQRCGTCRWHDVEGFSALYKENADDMGGMGFCRQRPPLPDFTRLLDPVGEHAARHDIFVFALWPETKATDWCGAWEAQDDPSPPGTP